MRIDYFDGSWILFRPSGTEPVFRIYTESTKESRTKEIFGNEEIVKKGEGEEVSLDLKESIGSTADFFKKKKWVLPVILILIASRSSAAQ